MTRLYRQWHSGAYIIFFQVGQIYYGTRVQGPFYQSSAEIEYNSAYTAGMALSHFMMLIHELLEKDPEIIPEEDLLIILDRKSAVCMNNNGKYIKYTRRIARI